MGLISRLFGSHSEREIKRIQPLVARIEALAGTYQAKSDTELSGCTGQFRQRLEAGASLDNLLPEAFAVVRETATRVIGQTHFPVQLIGGIVLHQGRIAEMKTGEGKTLVATLPSYLNALTGRGVHIVTVNDYLARFHSEWMGKIYRFLGLSVGLVVHGLSGQERRQAYASDITYGTNNEYGFDYLRDNMVAERSQLVQRGLNFAIVDEVDSILIDEARTPLIISGMGDASSDLYERANRLVTRLQRFTVAETDDKQDLDEIARDADYIVDEKAGSATLTSRGIQKSEAFFGVENLTDQENYQLNHHINNALKAHGTMHRDQQYVVKDGEIIIVDDFTGRLMFGRRYSNGLHQAIEAKEGVKIENENKTLATITFQNYFRMYGKLSGMTGTALTEENEFRTIYNLDVISIPTNKPMIRDDLPDSVFKTAAGKYRYLLEEVAETHSRGQPMLIGTISVEKSEMLSSLFRREGIPHHVLNAKQHEREAEIVAQAGRFGAVTIATNMAGRGTDILLGGNPEFLARSEMRKQGFDDELIEAATARQDTDDAVVLDARQRFRGHLEHYRKQTDEERGRVLEAGGLYILGTERHESRRIDNQLRGRAGRQGDPGKSRFFLSLEDDLMRMFGGERMNTIFGALGVDEDVELQHKMLSNAIENAQKRVESRNFSIRKHVLEYDDVMNKQREIIYGQRRQVLDGADLKAYYVKMIGDLLREVMLDFCAHEGNSALWDVPALQARLTDLFGDLPGIRRIIPGESGQNPEQLTEELTEEALGRYREREEEVGSAELLREAERFVLLRTVDNHWMEHIDAMDDLRDSIGMRGYAQHDPVVEYRKEGFARFDEMTAAIREDAVRLIMRARFSRENVRVKPAAPRQMVEKAPQADSAFEAERQPEHVNGSGTSQSSERHGSRDTRSAPRTAPRSSATSGTGAGNTAATTPVKRDQGKVGRNDSCPCGSGKKYKNCHGRMDVGA